MAKITAVLEELAKRANSGDKVAAAAVLAGSMTPEEAQAGPLSAARKLKILMDAKSVDDPIYHTSSSEIDEISPGMGSFGQDGDQIFFANDKYSPSGDADSKYSYALDLKKLNLVEARVIPSRVSIKDIEGWGFSDELDEFRKIGLSNDEILDVIGERQRIFDIFDENRIYDYENEAFLREPVDSDDLSDLEYLAQGLVGDISNKMGFDGAIINDEQGTAYVIKGTNIDFGEESQYPFQDLDAYLPTAAAAAVLAGSMTPEELSRLDHQPARQLVRPQHLRRYCQCG